MLGGDSMLGFGFPVLGTLCWIPTLCCVPSMYVLFGFIKSRNSMLSSKYAGTMCCVPRTLC